MSCLLFMGKWQVEMLSPAYLILGWRGRFYLYRLLFPVEAFFSLPSFDDMFRTKLSLLEGTNKLAFLTPFLSLISLMKLTSADEKNDPDIIPHDDDDEKDFERLYTPTQLNYVNRHSPNSHSPSLRFNEKQVRNVKGFCYATKPNNDVSDIFNELFMIL